MVNLRELLGLQLGFTGIHVQEDRIMNTVCSTTIVSRHIPKTVRVKVDAWHSLTYLVLVQHTWFLCVVEPHMFNIKLMISKYCIICFIFQSESLMYFCFIFISGFFYEELWFVYLCHVSFYTFVSVATIVPLSAIKFDKFIFTICWILFVYSLISFSCVIKDSKILWAL